MIAREGAGWQAVIADLALILFMVAASAVEAQHEEKVDGPPAATELGEPGAVWRPEQGVSLEDWLAAQAPDPRQQLTITAQHSEGGADAAYVQAEGLAQRARRPARIVLQPGTGNAVQAVLAYDQPDELAHGLQEAGQ
ncbi:MAG: hypothetical protein H6918_01405 [Sphingomonadaceae bacterium]|nr:hypothetical protein [Sphingomonadaceae bacterium]